MTFPHFDVSLPTAAKHRPRQAQFLFDGPLVPSLSDVPECACGKSPLPELLMSSTAIVIQFHMDAEWTQALSPPAAHVRRNCASYYTPPYGVVSLP